MPVFVAASDLPGEGKPYKWPYKQPYKGAYSPTYSPAYGNFALSKWGYPATVEIPNGSRSPPVSRPDLSDAALAAIKASRTFVVQAVDDQMVRPQRGFQPGPDTGGHRGGSDSNAVENS